MMSAVPVTFPLIMCVSYIDLQVIQVINIHLWGSSNGDWGERIQKLIILSVISIGLGYNLAVIYTVY